MIRLSIKTALTEDMMLSKRWHGRIFKGFYASLFFSANKGKIIVESNFNLNEQEIDLVALDTQKEH